MPKRLKFVVEQWVLFIVRRQTWRFKIFESARHFRIESKHPIRIRISKLRRSLLFWLLCLINTLTYLLMSEFLVDTYLWQNMCKLRCLVLPIKLQCLSARRVCSKLVSVSAHFIHPSASSCELHCQGCITRTWKYRLPCRMPALFNCLLAVLAAGTLVTRHYFIINFRFSLL